MLHGNTFEAKNMKYLILIISFLVCSTSPGFGQEQLSTNWKGSLKSPDAFSFEVQLFVSPNYRLKISNEYWEKELELSASGKDFFTADFGESLKAELKKSQNGYRLFIKSSLLFYHIALKETSDASFEGKWNIWMTPILDPTDTYLVFEQEEDNKALYPFFQDQRFTGTWAANYQWAANQVSFQDMKTGIGFRGEISKEKIGLDLYLAGQKLTHIDYFPMKELFQTGNTPNQQSPEQGIKDYWAEHKGEGKKLSEDILKKMEADIYAGELPNAHSVLIAQKGELLYEKYFYGHTADIFHDQRSASKSLSSAMTGIAIKDGRLSSVDQKLYDFIPKDYQYTWTEEKSEINLHNLLSMASGLDAIDDGRSAASEGVYQSSSDWLKTVLEASMIAEPGTKNYYGTANPYLLGIVLDALLENSLEWYMDEKLFEPLGISQYIVQSDDRGKAYFGGGVYLRPRDMLSFGQLYLNQGKWEGQEIFRSDWVQKSFQRYGPLLNVNDKNPYGYLFWHKDYLVNGKTYSSVEARGSGGQYIMILPEEEVVVVMTSGNYRNGRFAQPELILEKYILPALKVD